MVLDRSMLGTFEEFHEEHHECDISMSTFATNLPKNIETCQKRPWHSCLCESCTNVDLKIRPLTNLGGKVKSTNMLRDEYDALEKTV